MRRLLPLALFASLCTGSIAGAAERAADTDGATPVRRILLAAGSYQTTGGSGGSIVFRRCTPELVRLDRAGRVLGGTPFDPPLRGLRLDPFAGRTLEPVGRVRSLPLLLVIPRTVRIEQSAASLPGDRLIALAPGFAVAITDAIDAISGGSFAPSIRLHLVESVELARTPRGLAPGHTFPALLSHPDEIPILLWPYGGPERFDLRALAIRPAVRHGAPGHDRITVPLPAEVDERTGLLEREYLARLFDRRPLPDQPGRIGSLSVTVAHELLHLLSARAGVEDLADAASSGYRDDEDGRVAWGAWLALGYASLEPSFDRSRFPTAVEATIARDQHCPPARAKATLQRRLE